MKKKVYVVGAGRWGMNHIRTLDDLSALGAVVESNLGKHKKIKTDYPGLSVFPSVFDSFKESFDGYTVATPVETHYEIAKSILEEGKHVLVEKPLAMRKSHAETLNKIAREKNLNLMTGHLLLFHPAIQKIKDMLVNGKLGKLQYIYSNRLNLGAVRTEENILWSFAPHDISVFQFLIGESPISVFSKGGAFLQPHLHDTTLTVLRYPDNVVGHIFVSWLHPFKEHRLVVIGSKGMLSFEDSSIEKALLYYNKRIDWVEGEPITREGATEIIQYKPAMPLTEELRYFIDHLDGTPVSVSNGDDGIEVLEILEKATTSLTEDMHG